MRRVLLLLTLGFALFGPSLWANDAAAIVQQAGGVQAPPPAPGRGPAPAPAQVGTGLILGQVVDGVTGDPIADAVVSPGRSGGARSSSPGATASAVNVFQPILTGPDGRFVFRNLPPGAFSLTASFGGYVTGMVGQGRPGGPDRPLDLADGERIGDAKIRLWKHAAITGTVVDDTGDPAVEIAVRAYRRLTVEGRPQLVPGSAQTARTDDRGRFRFARLTPGDYVVLVPLAQMSMPAGMYDSLMVAMVTNPNAPPEWFVDLMLSGGDAVFGGGPPVRVGDMFWSAPAGTPPPSESGRSSSYRTTYYPSATSSSQASVITVRAGEERRGIDLQLALAPTSRVSGTVHGPNGPMANVGVRLQPATADSLAIVPDPDMGTAITRSDGTFTFLSVPPGPYVLRVVKLARSETMTRLLVGEGVAMPASAQAATQAAEQSIVVGETDVSGVSLMMRDGPKVSGRVEFDPTLPRTAAQMTTPGNGVTLTPLGGQTGLAVWGMMDPAVLDADGRFKTLGHAPDRYTIGFGRGGRGSATIKSITANGRDVTNAPLELRDSDVSDVVIRISDRLGSMSGVVRGPNGVAAQTATTVLFPADYRALVANGLMSGRVQMVAASRAGAYAVNGLVAGDYLVVALDDADISDSQDSVFFDAIARVATRVTLGDAEKKTQDLILAKVNR